MLVRYYSDTHCEVRVRFLKALVFGHAYAETVADELWKTLQEFSLPHKSLLSLSSDGPNVNKAIKTNINKKLMTQCSRQLVSTGSCQLYVVHNSFKKEVEAYGEDIENLCIDLFNFFKLSASKREDYAAIKQKLDLDEVVFLHHVESRWLSLLPTIERVRNQFPVLQDYFKKLPDSDKNIAKNVGYK